MQHLRDNIFAKLCTVVCALSILLPPQTSWAVRTPEQKAESNAVEELNQRQLACNLNTQDAAALQKCKETLANLETVAKAADDAHDKFLIAKKEHSDASAELLKLTERVQALQGDGRTPAALSTARASQAEFTQKTAAAEAKMSTAHAAALSASKKYTELAAAWDRQSPEIANKPTDPTATENVKKDAAAMGPKIAQAQAESTAQKGNMDGIIKTLLPLAAGAIGGVLLAGALKKDDDKKEDEDEEEDEVAEVAATTTTTECGENTVEENGICVVTSEEDKCFLDDGTEDTTKTRNADGNCVALDTLCETGYTYDSVDKVCEKSNCESGYTENDAGECVATGTTEVAAEEELEEVDPITGESARGTLRTSVKSSKVGASGFQVTK